MLVSFTSELRWLVGWLVSLFIQGKPLANGYYSRHPETIQYNKDKDEGKGTKAGGNSVFSKKNEGMGPASDIK